MNNHDGNANVPIPPGYITIIQSIERTIKSTSSLAGLSQGHHNINAWDRVRKNLYVGNISAVILKSDGSIEPIPKDFWGSYSSSYIGPHSDKTCVWDYDELDGLPLISENDFVKIQENFIWPLPQADMPNDLLFITSSDAEGNEIALTFMYIDDALDAFSEQRQAYFEESKDQNWNASRNLFLHHLQSGSIKSFHRDNKGLVRQLNPNDWRKDGPILSRVTRSDAKPNSLRSKASAQWGSSTDIQTDKGAIGGSIVVLSDNVFNILKGKSNNVAGPGKSNLLAGADNCDAASRVGRPAKYDAEAYLLEAFKIIYLGSPFPKSLEELCSRALTAYNASLRAKGASKDGSPSETWMKDRLRPLYNWAKDKNSDTNF